MGLWAVSLMLARAFATAILLDSRGLMRLPDERGLRATERPMAILLAVQMLLNGFGNDINRRLQRAPGNPAAPVRDTIRSRPQREGQ